jgi:hypothetical protein
MFWFVLAANTPSGDCQHEPHTPFYPATKGKAALAGTAECGPGFLGGDRF